ncbi:MAG: DUF1295 domain-containing protein [Ruminococcaceae bacterium]|nr:DUF1295 domain-containing protein [Oscillospiraceae bacterium]
MGFKAKKAQSIIFIALIYIVAAVVAFVVFAALAQLGLFWRLFAADAAATLFVYIAGLVLKNASVYDPYWSVAPPVILCAMMAYYGNFSFGALMLLLVVCYWAVRLTANWALCFTNLNHQDWRYDMLRKKTGAFYPVVSFVGIHFVPTIVVFLAMMPAVAYVRDGGGVNWGTAVGWAICILAATLQWVADSQMAQFRKTSARGELIRVGLWKYSRHPNYLGEILMWWGVYVIMVSVLPAQWPLVVGALANTLLFLVVSIPMADARYRQSKTGYAQYKRETRMLLPLKKQVRRQEEASQRS